MRYDRKDNRMTEHGYQTRTWEELKAETLARAERGVYPLFAISSDDARAALAMIHDLDPEAWGAAWMAVGDRYAERAQALEASDTSGAAQAYLAAWRLYTFGRWPVMSSPKKVASYAKAQAAFAAYGRLVTPAIEPLSIPFEGRDIKLWLQKPAGADRPPVTINIGGSDL
jgi:esterase FrsA